MPKHIKLFGVFAIALVLIGGMPKGAAEPKGTTKYVVERGDTISEIAEKITPDNMDYRVTIDYIMENNETEGTIYPGQELEVPIWEDTKW